MAQTSIRASALSLTGGAVLWFFVKEGIVWREIMEHLYVGSKVMGVPQQLGGWFHGKSY